MKVKTSELIGAQLDWAVAKALGEYRPTPVPTYSTDWAHGGPITEREKIDLFTEKAAYPESWCASVARYQNGRKLVGWRVHQYGPTPLIAAMRCYCCSKLGDMVDIPDELIGD